MAKAKTKDEIEAMTADYNAELKRFNEGPIRAMHALVDTPAYADILGKAEALRLECLEGSIKDQLSYLTSVMGNVRAFAAQNAYAAGALAEPKGP